MDRFNLRQSFMVILIVICYTTLQVQGEEDNRRPFFNIGHFSNTIETVDLFLNQGANAIESDVTFDQDGNVRWTYHGAPCDCFRNCELKEDIMKYLDYIRNVTTPGNEEFREGFVLYFLDLKVSDLRNESKWKAGESLATALLDHLWTPGFPKTQVYVLFYVAHSSDIDTLHAILETLSNSTSRDFIMKKIGWEIGTIDENKNITEIWTSLNVSGNVWVGEGDANCFTPFRSYTFLHERVKERNANPMYSKAYTWTIDMPSRIKNSIRLGADGMITNFPENVIEVLELPEIKSRVRLATIADNPFEKFLNEGLNNSTDFAQLEHETPSQIMQFVQNVKRTGF